MPITRMFGSLAPYWDVSFHEADSGVGMEMLRDGDWMLRGGKRLGRIAFQSQVKIFSSIPVDGQIRAGVFGKV